MALFLLSSLASQSYAEAQYNAYSYFRHLMPDYQSNSWSGSDEVRVTYYTGAWGFLGFTLSDGEGYAASSGHADAGALNLGANSWAVSMPNTYLAKATMNTQVSNRLTVTAGSSGLSNGDTVRLQLMILLDGTFTVAATPHQGVSGGTSANLSAGLTITDELSDTVARLDAFGSMYGNTSWSMFTGEFFFSSGWTESWQTQSNTGIDDPYSDSGTFNDTGAGEKIVSHNFNTGWLTLDFEAVVGQTLDVDAFLNTGAVATEDGHASADFLHTFALGITSTEPGVGLNWEVVPEPSSIALLGAGMAGLIARRRKARAM